MRNQGEGNFDYDSFKVMYDGDPKIQQLVTNFDQNKIEFKQSEVDDVNVAGKPGPEGDAVGDMAKNATDLGAEL